MLQILVNNKVDNTWLENSKISDGVLMYCQKFNCRQIIHKCSLTIIKEISSKTVEDRFSCCREFCTINLDSSFKEEEKIRCPGLIVEISAKLKEGSTNEEEGMRVPGFLVIDCKR